MPKIPQRNVNLANKLMRVAFHCLTDAQRLTGGDDYLRLYNAPISDPELETTQELLMDSSLYIREFRRKVNPVELKGQRG